MNRIRIPFIAVALAFTAGCASLVERIERIERVGLVERVERVEPVEGANQIAVYESSPPAPRKYVAVKRLWTQDRKSALRVPRYASAETGVADLRNQAVALGGHAIVNFGCYRLAPDLNTDVICNGTVVKYTQ